MAASILIAGDLCLHNRTEKCSIDEMLASVAEVRETINASDYSLVNLECAVTDKDLEPIRKCGPNLRNSTKVLSFIKEVGFCGVTLANNHFSDFGQNGVVESLNAIKAVGLDYVGGGMTIKEAQRILYKNISDQSVAFINCCEHEFTIAQVNKAGCNPLEIITLSRSISEARQNAKFVIVIIHGGNEHYNLPSPRMQDLYRFFVEIGADAIINHHQHCYSGYEYYRGKPIVYGLGNFYFDWEKRLHTMWNEGYMVNLEIEEDGINVNLIPYVQNSDMMGISLMKGARLDLFKTKIEYLNGIIQDLDELNKSYDEFVTNVGKDYLYTLRLPHNRWAKRLAKYGLVSERVQQEILPEFFSNERSLLLLNYIRCEAHHDVMIHLLENKDMK